MFKNYSDCEKCIHNSVCVYKLELITVYDKINGKWDNLNPPNIFNLALDCNQYRPDELVKNNGGLNEKFI